MSMLKILAVLVSLSMAQCSDPKDTVCSDYCDMRTVSALQDAENKLCTVSDEVLDQFDLKCENACIEVLEYVVDKEEQPDAETCLECITDTTVDPSKQHINEATEKCYEICNTLGNYQFFFSFYVSPPNWECD